MSRKTEVIDIFGSEASPRTLSTATVFGEATTKSLGYGQLALYVHYTPGASAEKITIQVQALEPGGDAAVDAEFADLVAGSVAAGVETLSSHTFEFTAAGTGEELIVVPLPLAYRAIRVGVKDNNAGSGGTAWIQADLLE